MVGERRAIGSHKTANHVFALYLTVNLEARARAAAGTRQSMLATVALCDPPLEPSHPPSCHPLLPEAGWRVPSAEKTQSSRGD